MKQSAVEFLLENIEILIKQGNTFNPIFKYYFIEEAKKIEKQQKSYNEEELLAFGKSCFYKGFEKAEKDDANCYTAFREEIGNLVEQLKNK
jgi:hypothetical protein